MASNLSPDAGHVPPKVFRAILFLDVVGPLQMARTAGDEQGWLILGRMKASITPLLQLNAVVVRDLGDRYLATFATVPDAIDAAVAIQREMLRQFEGEAKPPRLRIGVHAGDVLEQNEDVYGVEVYLAGRVCGYAEGGEIMVTEAARKLAEAAGNTYNDHGDVLLQSFEEPVRVWELAWKTALATA